MREHATRPAESKAAPAIVHHVLRSPGQPLDVATRVSRPNEITEAQSDTIYNNA